LEAPHDVLITAADVLDASATLCSSATLALRPLAGDGEYRPSRHAAAITDLLALLALQVILIFWATPASTASAVMRMLVTWAILAAVSAGLAQHAVYASGDGWRHAIRQAALALAALCALVNYLAWATAAAPVATSLSQVPAYPASTATIAIVAAAAAFILAAVIVVLYIRSLIAERREQQVADAVAAAVTKARARAATAEAAVAAKTAASVAATLAAAVAAAELERPPTPRYAPPPSQALKAAPAATAPSLATASLPPPSHVLRAALAAAQVSAAPPLAQDLQRARSVVDLADQASPPLPLSGAERARSAANLLRTDGSARQLVEPAAEQASPPLLLSGAERARSAANLVRADGSVRQLVEPAATEQASPPLLLSGAERARSAANLVRAVGLARQLAEPAAEQASPPPRSSAERARTAASRRVIDPTATNVDGSASARRLAIGTLMRPKPPPTANPKALAVDGDDFGTMNPFQRSAILSSALKRSAPPHKASHGVRAPASANASDEDDEEEGAGSGGGGGGGSNSDDEDGDNDDDDDEVRGAVGGISAEPRSSPARGVARSRAAGTASAVLPPPTSGRKARVAPAIIKASGLEQFKKKGLGLVRPNPAVVITRSPILSGHGHGRRGSTSDGAVGDDGAAATKRRLASSSRGISVGADGEEVPGWSEHLSRTQGQRFWHNDATGETTWTRPTIALAAEAHGAGSTADAGAGGSPHSRITSSRVLNAYAARSVAADDGGAGGAAVSRSLARALSRSPSRMPSPHSASMRVGGGGSTSPRGTPLARIPSGSAVDAFSIGGDDDGGAGGAAASRSLARTVPPRSPSRELLPSSATTRLGDEGSAAPGGGEGGATSRSLVRALSRSPSPGNDSSRAPVVGISSRLVSNLRQSAAEAARHASRRDARGL